MAYNHQMVTLARESRGLTQTELATQLGMPQGTLSKVESGDITVTDDFAKRFSRSLRYPLPFFEQNDPVYPFGASTFYHRKQQSVTSGVLRRIEARVNIYRFQIVRLLRATDMDRRNRFKRIDVAEHRGKIEDIAGLVRAAWMRPSGPIPNVTRMIEDNGGIVVRFSFGTAKMFGLSEWIPPAPPLFFLNDHPEITSDRDRFTLAHEVGHILLHALPNPNMEQEASRLAAELLMPSREIRAHIRTPVKLYTLAKLKPYWKVSMGALLSRARDLGIISENQFVYLRIQLQQKGYAHREPPELDIPTEHPTLLDEIIKAHVQNLGYGYADLARMVNVELPEFRSQYRLDDGFGGLRVVTA